MTTSPTTAAFEPPSLSGLIAALATPLDASGAVDLPTVDRIVDMLLAADVAGVCLGGATAEYPHTSRDERLAILERVARRLPESSALVVGIGAASPRDVIPLGRAAFDSGARAVLLSMPVCFPYAQDDLTAFCEQVASQLPGPVLLYDLPSFTTPLHTDTILGLLERVPNIVGIKDSSGDRERLATLAERRGGRPWRLIAGDDAVIADAMAAGWDGSISGLAGFCPELLVALVDAARAGRTARTAELFGLLQSVITRVSALPTPWGIRVGLAARGIRTGPLPLPLSSRRTEQVESLLGWLPSWYERVGEALGRSVVVA